jgi:hypothetical protein
MTAGLILQFPASVGEKEYNAVSSQIGFDPRTGEGDWPAGMQSHSAGTSDQGLVVTEVWDSKEAQAAFMQSRLGPALAGLPEPHVLWFDVIVSQHRH